jgi:hypothetical protein
MPAYSPRILSDAELKGIYDYLRAIPAPPPDSPQADNAVIPIRNVVVTGHEPARNYARREYSPLGTLEMQHLFGRAWLEAIVDALAEGPFNGVGCSRKKVRSWSHSLSFG